VSDDGDENDGVLFVLYWYVYIVFCGNIWKFKNFKLVFGFPTFTRP
jgi:hypothetical protein